MMRQFRVLKTFESPLFKSTYVEGMLYTIRPGNDLLATHAEDWRESGLIEYVESDGGHQPPLKIAGQGTVRWP